MKVKDISVQYGIEEELLVKFIKNSEKYSSVYEENFWGVSVPDNYVTSLVENYYEMIRSRESEKFQEIYESEDKRIALAKMLITSGFHFDGYTITRYSGYISGDDAISVDRGLSVLGIGGDKAADKLMGALVIIRRKALQELKEAAYDLGCNAIIGVDFDYLILDPETHDLTGHTKLQPYVFGVTANGNAVVIEKNK